jgi:hypothetical protein
MGPETFRTIRARDQLVLTFGAGVTSLNETILLTPIGLKDNLPPGIPNLAYVLISPLWMREGGRERPAFSTLRPYFQASHGRVRRFALLQPDGERVVQPNQMTPDCRYVLTLEFGHFVPKEFTVVVSFVSSRTTNPEAEFTYNPSNDGYPVRTGPTESVCTELRVHADPSFPPWEVLASGKVLPRVARATVQLQRELDHVIRFEQE